MTRPQGIWHNSFGRTTWPGKRKFDVGGQASAWRFFFTHWLPSNYQSCHSPAIPGPRGTSGNFSQKDAPVPSSTRHPIHLSRAQSNWLCAIYARASLQCRFFFHSFLHFKQMEFSPIWGPNILSRCPRSTQAFDSITGLFCPAWHRPHSRKAGTNLQVRFLPCASKAIDLKILKILKPKSRDHMTQCPMSIGNYQEEFIWQHMF